MTRKDDKGDQPSGGETTWTNTGGHDLPEDCTRQANLGVSYLIRKSVTYEKESCRNEVQ